MENLGWVDFGHSTTRLILLGQIDPVGTWPLCDVKSVRVLHTISRQRLTD